MPSKTHRSDGKFGDRTLCGLYMRDTVEDPTCGNCRRIEKVRGVPAKVVATPPKPPEGPPNVIIPDDSAAPLQGFLVGLVTVGFMLLCFSYC